MKNYLGLLAWSIVNVFFHVSIGEAALIYQNRNLCEAFSIRSVGMGSASFARQIDGPRELHFAEVFEFSPAIMEVHRTPWQSGEPPRLSLIGNNLTAYVLNCHCRTPSSDCDKIERRQECRSPSQFQLCLGRAVHQAYLRSAQTMDQRTWEVSRCESQRPTPRNIVPTNYCQLSVAERAMLIERIPFRIDSSMRSQGAEGGDLVAAGWRAGEIGGTFFHNPPSAGIQSPAPENEDSPTEGDSHSVYREFANSQMALYTRTPIEEVRRHRPQAYGVQLQPCRYQNVCNTVNTGKPVDPGEGSTEAERTTFRRLNAVFEELISSLPENQKNLARGPGPQCRNFTDGRLVVYCFQEPIQYRPDCQPRRLNSASAFDDPMRDLYLVPLLPQQPEIRRLSASREIIQPQPTSQMIIGEGRLTPTLIELQSFERTTEIELRRNVGSDRGFCRFDIPSSPVLLGGPIQRNSSLSAASSTDGSGVGAGGLFPNNSVLPNASILRPANLTATDNNTSQPVASCRWGSEEDFLNGVKSNAARHRLASQAREFLRSRWRVGENINIHNEQWIRGLSDEEKRFIEQYNLNIQSIHEASPALYEPLFRALPGWRQYYDENERLHRRHGECLDTKTPTIPVDGLAMQTLQYRDVDVNRCLIQSGYKEFQDRWLGRRGILDNARPFLMDYVSLVENQILSRFDQCELGSSQEPCASSERRLREFYRRLRSDQAIPNSSVRELQNSFCGGEASAPSESSAAPESGAQ